MSKEMNEKLQNAFKTFAKEKGLCTMNELQEKLDWLETNGYAKYNGEYVLMTTQRHVFHEITVIQSALGFLKASHNNHMERVAAEFKPQPKKEVEVDIKEVFRGTDTDGKKSVYVMSEVIIKFDGKHYNRIRGEFKFDATIHGDYAYYHELIRGSFL